MSIASFNKRQVRDFGGAFTSPDAINVQPNAATVARNVEFPDGSVQTRTGFGDTAMAPAGIVSSFTNWVFLNASAGQANQIVMYDRTYGGVRYADADSGSPTVNNAYTVSSGYAASFAPHGSRMYVAHYGTDGQGKSHARVLTFSGGSTAATDACFPRPLLTTEITVGASTGAGGSMTPGTHLLAFIAERRSGYIGKPGPAFPVLLTLVPGSVFIGTDRTATVTLTPATAWPADVVKVHLLMTTATNRARYLFVPGAVAAVSGSFAASFTVAISDDDLVRNGDEATKHMNLLTQDASGNPPFSPIGVFRAGKRIAYCVNDANYPASVFFSEPNNPQAINAGKNIFYTPQYTHGGFEIGGVYYMIGPAWTYSAQDNNREPVTWAAAKLVDGAIGTSSPLGFSLNSALGMAWVAAREGLFRFAGGAYDRRPISQYQSEWGQINWSAAYAVQVVDDAVKQRIYVLAPTGAATTADTLLMWDYSSGFSPEKARFAQFTFDRGIGGMGLMQNRTSKVQELWLAPASTSHAFRRQRGLIEAPLFTDGSSTAIDSAYRTAPLLSGKGDTMLSQHHGDMLRVTGAGNLGLTVYSLDQQQSQALPSVALSNTPDQWPMARYYMLGEDARLQLTNGNTAGAGFKLSAVEHLWTPHAAQR